jgi:hypothetical protein
MAAFWVLGYRMDSVQICSAHKIGHVMANKEGWCAPVSIPSDPWTLLDLQF